MYRQLVATFGLAMGLAVVGCGAPSASAPSGAPAKPAAATAAPPAAKPAAGAPAAGAAPAGQPAAGATARQPISPRVAVKYGELGQASDAGYYLALDRGYFT